MNNNSKIQDSHKSPLRGVGGLYLIPTTLGDTETDKILPRGNADIITSIRYFIVENIRTARRFLKKINRDIIIDELTFIDSMLKK